MEEEDNDDFIEDGINSGFKFLMVLIYLIFNLLLKNFDFFRNTFYFSFYAVKGERGLMRYVYLTEEVGNARNIAQKYAKERQNWEEKVRLLSSESLDLDLLEERARIVLNMVGMDEFIILDEDNEEK